jgi:ATPase subunit of ABC transporter with duplicated ATPase domains
MAGETEPNSGAVKWSENSDIGYCAQDHAADFVDDKPLFDWMEQWRQPSDDDQVIRGTLGRLLFSQDNIDKKVSVLSGGEKAHSNLYLNSQTISPLLNQVLFPLPYTF